MLEIDAALVGIAAASNEVNVITHELVIASCDRDLYLETTSALGWSPGV